MNLKAASKGALKAAVLAKFESIVKEQPVYEKDRAAVLDRSTQIIDELPDDADKDIALELKMTRWSGVPQCFACHTPRI